MKRAKKKFPEYRKILDLRKEFGWTQQELAKKAGISKASVYHIEQGVNVPSAYFLKKIANAFGVPISTIVGYSSKELKFVSNEDQIFLRRFSDIKNLSKTDQKIILTIVERMKNK